ncbi:MAG: hypothetical protein U1A72_10015, partial [Sulfuritalea sp.]|nr:hypothetical protein [Sulfuritalea sp.]
QVDERTNQLYGADQTNPDWQAFNRRMKQELRAKVAADVQQLAAIQRQAQGTVIDAILGSRDGGAFQPASGAMTVGGQMPAKAQITSFSGIQANPDLMRAWQMLDPGVKPALLNLMNRTFDATAGDPQLYRSLFNRIHLDPGAPGKIDFYKQIVDPAIADRLNMQQIQSLRAEIDRNETPGGRSINQMRKAADAQASNWFRTTLNSNINFAGQKLTNPTTHIDWTMRWNDEVGKKVDAYVAAGQPDKVRMMFMPGTPESVIEPAYLQTFVGAPRTAAQGLAAAAAGAQPQAAPIAQPTTIDTREKLDAWFKTLPPEVDRFVGTDGKVRMVPARQPTAAGQVPPAVALPATPAAQTATEKGVAPAASQAAPAAPMTAESFEVVEKPDNVAGSLAAIKAARTRASEIRKGGAQGPQYDLTGPIVSVLRGIKKGLLDRPAQLGQVLQAMIPTELEAVYAGFEAIKKARRVSRADQDILNEVIRYGLLTPDDEKLARKLLERIEKK